MPFCGSSNVFSSTYTWRCRRFLANTALSLAPTQISESGGMWFPKMNACMVRVFSGFLIRVRLHRALIATCYHYSTVVRSFHISQCPLLSPTMKKSDGTSPWHIKAGGFQTGLNQPWQWNKQLQNKEQRVHRNYVEILDKLVQLITVDHIGNLKPLLSSMFLALPNKHWRRNSDHR